MMFLSILFSAVHSAFTEQISLHSSQLTAQNLIPYFHQNAFSHFLYPPFTRSQFYKKDLSKQKLQSDM
uniref:Uncharacterized protein n=1 Tax=Anguilla anguilla TaxID=7936 RepID=A0A0E9WSC0_ANGAN